MALAIEVEDLVKRYPPRRGYRDLIRRRPRRGPAAPALDGVTLRIAEGEAFGLLGQNGAGKTTLIRILMTALLPTSGTARVGGHDVVHEMQEVRRLIGVVNGDERSFYWRLSGRQNLDFYAALYHVPAGQRRARIGELLERVGLDDAADRQFQTYSSGMRQRLGIARGLLTRPRILFMDEPTRSLDPISARDVRELVREHVLGDPRRTVLLATHSMAEAEQLCDRLALVRRGHVVAAGALADLRRELRYGTGCELELRGGSAELGTRIRGLAGILTFEVQETPESRLFRLTLGEDPGTLSALLGLVLGAGAQVLACRTNEVSLEEIFLRTLDERPLAQPEGALREAVA